MRARPFLRPGEPVAVRLPNWVGDACMALPALRRLHESGHPVTAFGRGWAAALLAGTPHRVVKLPAGIMAGASVVRASGLRRGVLLTNSLSSAMAFRLAGVAAAGHPGEGRWLLLGRARARRAVHEVEAFWELAGLALGEDAAVPAALGLEPTSAQRAAAQAAVTTAGVSGAYAVLCPLAVGTIAGRSKMWPEFTALAQRIAGSGLSVVACPGPGEEAAMRALLPTAALLPGLDLGAYAAVCAGARVTVANDSGPMHLAAAVGAAVVGVFGPGDPRRTRPWGPRAVVVGGGGAFPELDPVWAQVRELV